MREEIAKLTDLRDGIEIAICSTGPRMRTIDVTEKRDSMSIETFAPPLFVIRPGLDALRAFPTLCEIDEAWGKIELKLETNDTRYWVTTEGVVERSRQVPPNYVVNYVTVEKRSSEGRWNLSAVFSPEAWKLSQAFDYCQLLYRELRHLNEQLERQFHWEIRRQIDGVRAEIESTNRVIRGLLEQVRARDAETVQCAK
jgi:hypothetical protein